MRILIGIAATAALLYVGGIALLYGFQRRFVFPASSDRVAAAAAGLSDTQDVVIETADGERLVGWWLPPEPGRALVLYFHGNGGSLWNRRDRVRLLAADGRGLLIVSYRGYSGSSGSPSEAGLRLDAEAAYRFLARYDPKRVLLYGESLGSGVAVDLASRHPVGAVVLDSPFTSLTDVARLLFPFAPVGMLLRDTFPSVERIDAIRAPLLVIHGESDRVVPIALGERLFAAAREPKRFVRLPGIDHVSALERGGLAAVKDALAEVEARLAAVPAAAVP